MTSKLCECGCGLPAPISKVNNKRYGWVKGEPKRFIHNHHFRGHRNVNYNRGLCLSDGRWLIHCRDHTYVLYSRAVVESELRRELSPNEVVHHIDGNTENDVPHNLMLCLSQADHMREHRFSDAYLLDKIRYLASELGRPPTSGDLKRTEGMPTRETYRIRFGSLKQAKQLALGKEGNNDKNLIHR